MSSRIACVIVTYNRKALLGRCLEAVSKQSCKPSDVFILDNASTDGTQEFVENNGFFDTEVGGIFWHYIRNQENEGGAGGFYRGMKAAFEYDSFDGIWVMDDDGEPSEQCLENLAGYLDRYDYIAPIVLSDEDRRTCSFASSYTLDTFAASRGATTIVVDFASPFNGILYSRKLIERIGFPKKDMFIWGDEQNYHFRAKKVGMDPVTVLSAIHYHPLDRHNYVNFHNNRLNVVNADWKLYCYLRNSWYNKLRFSKNVFIGLGSNIKWACLYAAYYRNWSKFFLISDAFLSAMTGDFTRLSKYRK